MNVRRSNKTKFNRIGILCIEAPYSNSTCLFQFIAFTPFKVNVQNTVSFRDSFWVRVDGNVLLKNHI